MLCSLSVTDSALHTYCLAGLILHAVILSVWWPL